MTRLLGPLDFEDWYRQADLVMGLRSFTFADLLALTDDEFRIVFETIPENQEIVRKASGTILRL